MTTRYTIKTRDQHLSTDGRPKRILALDGGGLRGILTLGMLARVEELLRQRHGAGPEFRLAHYFDLIAGTSTGAIIAAALAQGMSVAEVLAEYNALGTRVFEKSWLRLGVLRAKYDEAKLSKELKRVFGEKTTLGSDKLITGLVVVTKRLDTGSPWPLLNNPRGQFFGGIADGSLANADYPLWQVVRASTAAPSFFDPETLTIGPAKGKTKPVTGSFVDGGVSPFNNPALQALMCATMDGYRIGWPTGADKLLVVSLGTGMPDPAVSKSAIAAGHAIGSLLSLMQDVAVLQQTVMQWLSSSPTARTIDLEVGDLRHDLLAGAPLIGYLRYDVDLSKAGVRALDASFTDDKAIESLSEMDAPENMKALHALGSKAGLRDVRIQDFPAAFDLPLAG